MSAPSRSATWSGRALVGRHQLLQARDEPAVDGDLVEPVPGSEVPLLQNGHQHLLLGPRSAG